MLKKLILFTACLCVILLLVSDVRAVDLGTQEEPTIVKVEQGEVSGYLITEYMYQMDFYQICEAPGRCATLGCSADLKLDDNVDNYDNVLMFFPSEMQFVKVSGSWNFMSDNSIYLDTSKPFEIWAKANNYTAQEKEFMKIFE